MYQLNFRSVARHAPFGVRQFIAAFEYFGLRRVPAPLFDCDTSRVAFEVREG